MENGSLSGMVLEKLGKFFGFQIKTQIAGNIDFSNILKEIEKEYENYENTMKDNSSTKATRDVEFRCFVGNLAWRTNNQTLGEAFAPFGKVVNSKVIYDRDTGKSRGIGFVTFTNEKSVRDAIWKMDGSLLDGCYINVVKAKPPGYHEGRRYGGSWRHYGGSWRSYGGSWRREGGNGGGW